MIQIIRNMVLRLMGLMKCYWQIFLQIYLMSNSNIYFVKLQGPRRDSESAPVKKILENDIKLNFQEKTRQNTISKIFIFYLFYS